jgi:glutaredoxin-related protein
VGAFVALQVLVLYMLGQPALCECGYIKVWEGVVASVGNSQHLSDWYTFSHIIHGIIFYAVLWKFFPRVPRHWLLAVALGAEVAWEVLENTPMVIEHYRNQALAQGYVGDSILNSVSDTLAMVGGFLLAWRLPVWASVALVLVLELFVGYQIRDGLLLNIVNLAYPFEIIERWQTGG